MWFSGWTVSVRTSIQAPRATPVTGATPVEPQQTCRSQPYTPFLPGPWPPQCGSERTVFLAPELVELLASHIACNGVEPEPTSWLFRGDGENPPHQNTVGHWWRRTCQRAGIERFTLHVYASGLVAAGCDVVTVQRSLGHATASTTLNTYSHLWPTAEDRTRKAADAMLAEAMRDPKDSVRTQAGS